MSNVIQLDRISRAINEIVAMGLAERVIVDGKPGLKITVAGLKYLELHHGKAPQNS